MLRLSQETYSREYLTCQKLEKSIFQINFELEFQLETTSTKTNILPKAGKINFSIIF